MHKLLIEDDEGKTVAVPLIREEITIGRMEGNTIRLTEQNVSRKHARLILQGGVLSIEDLGSYNGTSLNGSALTGPATLKDGDVILIGDYRLGIQEEKAARAEPPAAAPAETPASAAPAVQDALDAQPTIPISTLGVQAAIAEMPARLLVIGRFMSGTEFVLDRPSMVIGRTPENDIIINHKSISRHHAKIVRDGEHHIILDLESANGVRIGGTEHDRVELQAGDVIELGEVRLRFVTGDTALYDDHAVWYRDKTKLAVIGGGSAVVLGALLYVVFSGSSARQPEQVVAVQPAPAPVAAPAPPPPPPEPKPVEPLVPVSELLAEAKKSAQAEKWDEAFALVAKAVAQEPGSEDAANMRKAIEAEQQYSQKVVVMKASLENKDFDAVLQAASEIPDESMYKPQVLELSKQAQALFVVAHLEAAAASLADKDCEQARSHADLVLGVDAKNKKASVIVKRCEAMAAKAEQVAAAPKQEPAPKRASRPVAVAEPAKPAARHSSSGPSRQSAAAKPEGGRAEAPPAVDAERLIKDAQQAWLRGQHAAAIDYARKALRVKPNLTNAYQIIAICSCALRDAGTAARAYEKLDERNKLYVKTSCQKNGISF